MSESLLPILQSALPVAVGTPSLTASATGEAALASPEAFLQALTQFVQAGTEGEPLADGLTGFAELVAQVTTGLDADGTPAALVDGEILPESGNPLPDDAGLAVLNLMLTQGAALTAGESPEQLAQSAELTQAIADVVGPGNPRPRAALMAVLHAAAHSAVGKAGGAPVQDGKSNETLGQLIAQAVHQVKAAVAPAAEVSVPVSNAIASNPSAATPGIAAAQAPSPLAQNANPTNLLPQALDLPVKHQGWGESLGQRVQWMVGQKLQSAQLTLNPPHLGTLEVRINIHQDQAVINFNTPHAAVREALEAALPRLREMLGEQGLQLSQANVSQQSFADQQRRASGQGGEAAGRHGADFAPAEELVTVNPTVIRQGQGLLDTYA